VVCIRGVAKEQQKTKCLLHFSDHKVHLKSIIIFSKIESAPHVVCLECMNLVVLSHLGPILCGKEQRMWFHE